jgi:2,5-diamino-6-(ribosylamino)-4(3H)-pyrimidinone 5'-phosphate reductase
MKPYIICHMMASVDGRIDCAMTEQLDSSDSYYEALDQLDCPTTIEGRVTMQMHYALPEPFVAASKVPVGHTAFRKAASGNPGYDVAIDTHGKLRWPSSELNGRPLLVIACEDCAKEYFDTLDAQGISWIAVGKGRIDLAKAMNMLWVEFGVERIALVGGGHINGAFLAAGLIDEVSLIVGPGIDGRKGMAAVFDGIDDPDRPATLLRLQTIDRLGDTVWMRYKLI